MQRKIFTWYTWWTLRFVAIHRLKLIEPEWGRSQRYEWQPNCACFPNFLSLFTLGWPGIARRLCWMESIERITCTCNQSHPHSERSSKPPCLLIYYLPLFPELHSMRLVHTKNFIEVHRAFSWQKQLHHRLPAQSLERPAVWCYYRPISGTLQLFAKLSAQNDVGCADPLRCHLNSVV